MTSEDVLLHFKEDVRDHVMKIIRDDGVYRHIRFRSPVSSCYYFDLVTWPGYLTICGDCGTYTFMRTTDMFSFFRMDERDFNYTKGELSINIGYWAEKLQHGSGYRRELYTEWDEGAFRERVEEFYKYWLSEFDESQYEDADGVRDTVKAEIEELKNAAGNEFEAVVAVHEFCSEHIELDDFWDGSSCRRPTTGFMWCLYGIVWGIQSYDREKLLTPAMKKFLAITEATAK